jgi:tRNA pseudouridine38-40 synthase
MQRYFLEVYYRGTGFSGFQVQQNANTIQEEIEKAFGVLHKEKIVLTASSRTDAGVHALQNYFHFDSEPVNEWRGITGPAQLQYKLNAILPDGIAIAGVVPVKEDAHSRFDALSREYKYFIYGHKDPFLKDEAFYFPYRMDVGKLKEAAKILMEYQDFTSFSKRNTQVKTFICQVNVSEWGEERSRGRTEMLVYRVSANRFLRGMVRALTATMLKVGRGRMSLDEFRDVIEARDCTKASFSVPAHGLTLVSVKYPAGYFGEG